MHPQPRHHLPGHYRHRVWAVNSLTVIALGLIPLSAMAAAGQRAGDAITPAVQAVPPPPTAGSQPTGVLELITAPSTTATPLDLGKDGPEPTRACRCLPRQPLTVEPPSATTGPPAALSASVTASTPTAGVPVTPAPTATAPSATQPVGTTPATSSSPSATTPATTTPATSTAATTTAATSEAALSTQATPATSEEVPTP